MIVGLSGKMQSGKSTVGNIIRTLTSTKPDGFHPESEWQIRKFAQKLKQICSILTGIPEYDFEKQEVKDRVLGEEWWKVYKHQNWVRESELRDECEVFGQKFEKVIEDYELINAEHKIYRATYLDSVTKMTVRELLQRVGTEAMRDTIHPNVWVNALFADYKETEDYVGGSGSTAYPTFSNPKWIITDVRFKNEADAIKERGGLVVRIERPTTDGNAGNHPSETALDDYSFDYRILNNGTHDDLVLSIKEFLTKFNIK